MANYLAPVIFVVLLGLCAAGYAFIAFELDGSTISTKQYLGPSERPR